jgi:hypothetical protein
MPVLPARSTFVSEGYKGGEDADQGEARGIPGTARKDNITEMRCRAVASADKNSAQEPIGWTQVNIIGGVDLRKRLSEKLRS